MLERLAYIATSHSDCCGHFEALCEKDKRVAMGVVEKFDKRNFKHMALMEGMNKAVGGRFAS